jgi:hypothetical protein
MPKSKKKKKPGKLPKVDVPKGALQAPSPKTDPSVAATADSTTAGVTDIAAPEPNKPDIEEETKGAQDNAAAEQKKPDTEEGDGSDADKPGTESKNSTRVVKIWFHKTGSEVKKTHEASKEVKEMLEKLKPNLTLRVSPRRKEERDKIDCPSNFPSCRSKKSLS